MGSKRTLRIAPVIALLSLATCADWTPQEGMDVVWADDDNELGLMIVRFENRPPGLGDGSASGPSRNFRYQLYVEQPNGTGRTPITSEIPGEAGFLFLNYYMKTRGYFVVRHGPDGGSQWYERIAKDGSRKEIVRIPLAAGGPDVNCEGRYAMDVVPSPNGVQLAVIRSMCPGGGKVGMSVRFLDAATLGEIKSETVAVPIGIVDWTWRPAGDFVVVGGTTAWSLAADRAATATTVPKCFSPKTTSGSRSSKGIGAFAVGVTVHQESANSTLAFGCQ